MKKPLSFLLVMILLSALLMGCKAEKAPASSPDLLSRAEESGEPLRVCVDSRLRAMADEILHGMSLEKTAPAIQFDVLPEDDLERNAKIQNLRTALIAGAGPDAFILYTPADKYFRTSPACKEFLFSDLNAIVHKDFFLPLDELIEKSELIDLEGCPPAVLDAGKSDKGQVVLPFLYTFPFAAVKSERLSDPGFTYSTWSELRESEEAYVRHAVFDGRFLSNSFSFIFDYQKGSVAFSKEELAERYKGFVSEDPDIYLDECVPSYDEAFFPLMSSEAPKKWDGLPEKYKVFSMPNELGGTTASITLSLAINTNSKSAEEAFSFFEYFFHNNVVTGSGFRNNTRVYCKDLFGSGKELQGICVKGGILEKNCPSDEAYQAARSLLETVNAARFYSDVDYYLYDNEFSPFYASVQSEEAFAAAIDGVYSTLQMMAAES